MVHHLYGLALESWCSCDSSCAIALQLPPNIFETHIDLFARTFLVVWRCYVLCQQTEHVHPLGLSNMRSKTLELTV